MMILKLLIIPIKFILIVLMIITYIIVMYPLAPMLKRDWVTTKRRYLLPALAIVSKMILKIMNVKVNKIGDSKIKKGTLIVSNHQSYFDLFITLDVAQASFICAEETSKEFFIGTLIKLGGCLFINRHTRDYLSIEIQNLKDHLDSGISVALCPEGKCFDGSEVHRFKKPFFASATERKEDITCFTINYKQIDNEVVSSSNKHKVLWYRQNTVLKHFFSLLKFKKIEVDCYINKLNYVDYSKSDKHVADLAWEVVNNDFKPLK